MTAEIRNVLEERRGRRSKMGTKIEKREEWRTVIITGSNGRDSEEELEEYGREG